MKALWITSHKDTINSIRPEAETLLGLARAGVELEIMTQGTSPYREAMATDNGYRNNTGQDLCKADRSTHSRCARSGLGGPAPADRHAYQRCQHHFLRGRGIAYWANFGTEIFEQRGTQRFPRPL